MASLNIRGIPDQLVKALKQEAAGKGMTLKALVLAKLATMNAILKAEAPIPSKHHPASKAKERLPGTCPHGTSEGTYCGFCYGPAKVK